MVYFPSNNVTLINYHNRFINATLVEVTNKHKLIVSLIDVSILITYYFKLLFKISSRNQWERTSAQIQLAT